LTVKLKKVNKQIVKYDAQEKRLVQLFRFGQLTRTPFWMRSIRLKGEREEARQKVDALVKSKELVAKLENVEAKFNDCCRILLKDLDNASYEEKIELLDMLAINATATVDGVDVKGVIPMKITPSDVESASAELTHHWTNMGITVRTCTGLPFSMKYL
jgi:hypothetical protein